MSRVLIVGGGLIGLLTARALRARGLDVTLLERGAIGHEASRAGGGILSPLHPWRFPDAVTALARRGQALWAELAKDLRRAGGIDPEYRPGGMTVIGDDDPDEVAAWAARHRVPLQRLARDDLAAREPGLRPPPGRAWLLPDVASVRPPALLPAVAAAAAREGILLREQVPVTGIAVRAGRVEGVDTDTGRTAGDAVIVCAGAWSSAPLAGLGAEPPGIRPVRGQMLAWRGAPGWLRHVVLHHGRYLIPRRDGVIVAGSTLEETGYDNATTAEARAELAAFAGALLPALADAPVAGHWAGLRPASDDGVPTIAAHPRVAGLWINAGHFRNGIVTAPSSAELLADLLAGDPPALASAPFAWPA